MPSVEERFRAKVDYGDDHDRWTGARDRRGVGMVRIDGKLRTVQRAAWEFAHGPLPRDVRVNSCAGERACVRVAHLSVSAAGSEEPTSPPSRRRRKGTGSVREVRPGVWRIVVTDPTGGASQRRSVTVHGSRRDADSALQRLVAATTRTELGDLRVRELVARHLDARGEESGSPDRGVLHEVLEPTIGARLAAMLTPMEVEAALREPLRAGADRASIRDALRLLRGAYRWAEREGWSTLDPAEGITVRDLR